MDHEMQLNEKILLNIPVLLQNYLSEKNYLNILEQNLAGMQKLELKTKENNLIFIDVRIIYVI